MVNGLGPLDLVTIQVRDWAEAVRWYTQVLGLPIITLEEEAGFCMLGTDGPRSRWLPTTRTRPPEPRRTDWLLPSASRTSMGTRNDAL